MKKHSNRKSLLTILVFCIMGCIFGVSYKVQAEIQKEAIVYVGFRYEAFVGYWSPDIKVPYISKGDSIRNLKTNSRNLIAWEKIREDTKKESTSWIGLYAKKAGTYKLSFDIYKADNTKRSSHTIVVYAQKYKGFWKINNKYPKNTYWTAENSSILGYTTRSKSVRVTFVVPKGCKMQYLQIMDTQKKFRNGTKIEIGENVCHIYAHYINTYTNREEVMPLYIVKDMWK